MAPDAAQPEKKRPGIWKETILIVVSVALGYMASQYADYREQRQLAEQALEGIQKEITDNLSSLEPLVPLHHEWSNKLAIEPSPKKAGIDVFFETRPPLPPGSPSPFPYLRSSAWDAALAGGALRHLDYELVSSLSELYKVQEVVHGNINRLAEGVLVQVEVYDPDKGAASTRLFWLTLSDIGAAEQQLLVQYKKHLSSQIVD